MANKKAQQVLAAVRLRAVSMRRHFGSALFALTLIDKPGHKTMSVDRYGRVYADTSIIGPGKDWSVEDGAVGLIHELGHWLRGHHPRAKSLLDLEEQSLLPLLHRFMNAAEDAELNDDLEQEGLKLLDTDMTPEKLGKLFDIKLPDNQLFEAYWAAIRDQAHSNSQRTYEALKKLAEQFRECGSGAHGVPMPWDLPPPDGQTPGIGEAEGELLRKLVAQEIRAEASRNPGSIAAGWRRWADTMLEPAVVPWERELCAQLLNAVTMARGLVDYSYARPSRRGNFGGIIRPAMVRPNPEVGVVIDTSGSMQKEDLTACLRELQGILRSVGQRRCTVVCADAEVQAVQSVSSAFDVELRGGGGTDMGPGIEALQRLGAKVIVVLTDGYTPWPEDPPRNCQLVVGVIGGDEDEHWQEYLQPYMMRVLRIPRQTTEADEP